MDSPEGKGIARARIEEVKKAGFKIDRPVKLPFASRLAGARVADLLGFWTIWHLYGGFEGARRLGFSRSAIYRRIRLFRDTFGVHPDEFEVTGLKVDPMAYWTTYGTRR
jgi:hypothetical protein